MLSLKQIEWKHDKYGFELARHLQKLHSFVPRGRIASATYVYNQKPRWHIKKGKHSQQH